MILRDALDIKKGTQQVNKIYKGTYKVWDRNKIALEGYCKQNTTEGINLIEPKIATGTTRNGITITNNGDGSYIINGTATTGTDIRLDQSIPVGTDNLKNYTAGTYSLSCNELKTGLRLVLMQNQTWANLIEMRNTNTPITKYIEATNNVFFYLYIESGATYNNYIIRPQLEKSSTVHDWEPYTGGQPSPNPNYEQPIEVMQGRQVVPIKKERFDKNNANIIDNAYIYQAGATVINSNGNKTLYIPCKPNTTYTVQKVLSSRFSVGTFSQEPTIGTTINKCVRDYEATELSITTGANDTYLGVWYYRQLSDTTITEQEILNSIEIMENSEYTVDLKSKNLFNENSEWNINASAGLGNAEGEFPLTKGGERGTYFFECEPNTTYTVSYKTKGDRLAVYEHYSIINPLDYTTANKLILDHLIAGYTTEQSIPDNSYTFTTGANAKMVAIYYSLNTKPTEFQIEKNPTPTSYEPFYDYKLAGIGDYKDNFYTDKGKWYLKQNIGNVVLIGDTNELYTYQNNARFYLRREYFTDKTVPKNPTTNLMGVYCNRFVEQTRSNTWAGVEGISYDNPNTTLEPIGSSFDIACNSVATTAEAFKTWLSTHNLDIWYLLQNPQITEIPNTYTTLINQLNALYQAM